jgi:hypothetical protein
MISLFKLRRYVITFKIVEVQDFKTRRVEMAGWSITKAEVLNFIDILIWRAGMVDFNIMLGDMMVGNNVGNSFHDGHSTTILKPVAKSRRNLCKKGA